LPTGAAALAAVQRAALQPKERGPKPSVKDPLRIENAQLQRENTRLTKKLRRAEHLIGLQKISQIRFECQLGLQQSALLEGNLDLSNIPRAFKRVGFQREKAPAFRTNRSGCWDQSPLRAAATSQCWPKLNCG
jgi:hypothetical protein